MPEPHASVFSGKSPVLIDGKLKVERAHEKFYKLSTIEYLPEEVILEVFYLNMLSYDSYNSEWQEKLKWHRLSRVCRRWRAIVFTSQHRLDLWLLCTPKTSIAKTLDIWPAFRIVVRNSPLTGLFLDDDITAAFQQRDRVCKINLHVNGPLFERVSQIVQPFPLLEELELRCGKEMACMLPSTFLGGSAPRLRILRLDGIAFPALPRPLSSATNLVDLQLQQWDPSTEYISPEALVSGLSATTQLKFLQLSFDPAKFHSNPRNAPPPWEPIVFPDLDTFYFDGTSNYLEDLLSRISAPSLEDASITFLDPPGSDVLQLPQFLGRIEPQWLPDLAQVSFSELDTFLSYPMAPPAASLFRPSSWLVVCLTPPFPHIYLSLMTRICQQIPPSLSSVRSLRINAFFQPSALGNNENIAQWLGLLRVFDRVERLLIAGHASASFACALQRVSVEMAAHLVPALRELHLSGATSESQKAVTSFIAMRNLAGLPDVKFIIILNK